MTLLISHSSSRPAISLKPTPNRLLFAWFCMWLRGIILIKISGCFCLLALNRLTFLGSPSLCMGERGPGAHQPARAGLHVSVLLPQPPNPWDCSWVPARLDDSLPGFSDISWPSPSAPSLTCLYSPSTLPSLLLRGLLSLSVHLLFLVLLAHPYILSRFASEQRGILQLVLAQEL